LRSALVIPLGRQGPGRLPPAVVARLEHKLRRRAASMLPGDHLTPGAGDGMELAQLRPYEPGDDVRRLDPAATARTGQPHVRLQVPERQLTTWLVLDLSASMAFGTADRLKSDVAEGAALVIGRIATRRGGRLGLVTCGSDRDRILPPRGGRTGYVALTRVLGEGVGGDGQADDDALGRALGRTGRIAQRAGLVTVVSDFRGPRDWRRALAGLGVRHSILAIEVRDPREGALPDVGHLSLVDPESGRHIRVDSSDQRLRRRYARAEQEERAAVAADLRRAGARHVILRTDRNWLRDLGRELAVGTPR
jgi:uncharacterized protein (DUF58 family)